MIRASIAYAESAERATSILDLRPDLGGDYLALAGELLDRLGLPEARGSGRAPARLRAVLRGARTQAVVPVACGPAATSLTTRNWSR